MADEFNPYHVWLGIPPEEQPANHYRLLSLRLFETDGDVIDSAADRQMAHLRTFQSGKHGELTQRLLNEVAAARICLLDPKKRAAYDQQLRAKLRGANRLHRRLHIRASRADRPFNANRRAGQRRRRLQRQASRWPQAAAAAGRPMGRSARRSDRPNRHRAGGKSATSAKAGAAKRDANNRNISIGIAAGVVLIAAWRSAFFAERLAGRRNACVRLAADDRADTTVTVDDVAVPAPASGAWEYQCPAGSHHIVAQRPAYKLDARR